MSFGSAKPQPATAPAEMPAEAAEQHEGFVSRAMHGVEHFLHLDGHQDAEATEVHVQTVQNTAPMVTVQTTQSQAASAPHESFVSRAVHGVEHFLHMDTAPQDAEVMSPGADAAGEESSLAAEVLQLSNILAQDGIAKEGVPYSFPVEDMGGSGGGRFELSRDDTLHLIGLLNSPEIDFAKRELSTLLRRLDRPAVEGLTRQLFAALRRRSGEMAILEDKALRTQKASTQGYKKPKKRRDDMPITHERAQGSQQHVDEDMAAGPATLVEDIKQDGVFHGIAHWVKDHTGSSQPAQAEPADGDFVHLHGELSVRVVAAFNLMHAPKGGILSSGDVADPFVCLRVGSEEYKTQVVTNTVNPVWDSDVYTFIIDTSSPEGRILSLEVFHNGGHFHSNKRLGFLQIDILNLLHQGPIRNREKLQGGGEGELEVELLFKPQPQAHQHKAQARRAGGPSSRGARSMELPVGTPRSMEGSASGRASKASGGRKGEEMPQVFRRLTAPATSPSFDELIRARATLASGSSAATPLTVGGIMSTETGPQASAYLEALLEAHENETGVPATSSRRQLISEEDELGRKRTPRVPEEKAKEIFDRLYKSGKEHRVRRRVYHELGLLVEQAKEAQTCTHLPCVPLAAYPGGQPLESSVSERLYREGMDRMRRREEMQRSVPAPSFRPQILAGPIETRQPQFVQSPRDLQLPPEDGGLSPDGLTMPNEDEVDEVAALPGEDVFVNSGDQLGNYQPPHLRLYNESYNRMERQRNREEDEAEWKKFNYKPDISTSQASGPQVLRAASLAGFPTDDSTEDYQMDEGGPSLAALAADALTPRDSDQPEEVSTDFNAVGAEFGEALLLLFPEASWPAASNFEDEVSHGLADLGATCLGGIDVRLPAGQTIGGVTAELTGAPEALAELRELNLLELVVLGYRVGEVRWTSVPSYMQPDGRMELVDANPTGSLEPPPEEEPDEAEIAGEDVQLVGEMMQEEAPQEYEQMMQEQPFESEWTKAPEGFQPFEPEVDVVRQQAIGPAWTRGEIEKPAGIRDMGGWSAGVYTEEQQMRLNIDENGNPLQVEMMPSSMPSQTLGGGAPPPPLGGYAGGGGAAVDLRGYGDASALGGFGGVERMGSGGGGYGPPERVERMGSGGSGGGGYGPPQRVERLGSGPAAYANPGRDSLEPVERMVSGGSIGGGSLGPVPAGGSSLSGGGQGSVAASVATTPSAPQLANFSPRDQQSSTPGVGGYYDGSSSAPQPRASFSNTPGSMFGPPVISPGTGRGPITKALDASAGLPSMRGTEGIGKEGGQARAELSSARWGEIETGGSGLTDERALPYVKPPTLIANTKASPNTFSSASFSPSASTSLTPTAPQRTYSGRLPTHARQDSRGMQGGTAVMLTTAELMQQDRLQTERLRAELPSTNTGGYMQGSQAARMYSGERIGTAAGGSQTARMYSGERLAAASGGSQTARMYSGERIERMYSAERLSSAGGGSQVGRMYSAERVAASGSAFSGLSPRTETALGVSLPFGDAGLRGSGVARVSTAPLSSTPTMGGGVYGGSASTSGALGSSLFAKSTSALQPPPVVTPTLGNRPSLTGGTAASTSLLSGTPGTPRHPLSAGGTGPPVFSGLQPRQQPMSSASANWLSGASSLRSSTLAY